MAKSDLEDILITIFLRFNNKSIANYRLTKLVYLLDWLSCMKLGSQVTDIKWKYHSFGPYVDNIAKVVENSIDIFHIENQDLGSSSKKRFKLKSLSCHSNHKVNEKLSKLLDYVYQKTHDLNSSEFIDLVYSTYPVRMSDKYSELDLEKLARQFKNN